MRDSDSVALIVAQLEMVWHHRMGHKSSQGGVIIHYIPIVLPGVMT